MGCSASTPQAQHASAGVTTISDAVLPRGRRDALADKHAPSNASSRRFEAPASGEAADAPAQSALRSSVSALQWASLSPALLVLDDFLTADECDGLVALAQNDLRRSRVTDGHVSSGRTSFSTFLTGVKAMHPLVTLVEKRVTDLVSEAHKALLEIDGGDAAAESAVTFVAAEPLQVVRYTVSQGYCPHYDNAAGRLARKVTFMVYLCDVEEGGYTHFPRARPVADEPDRAPGLRIQPRKGRAVCFWNIRGGREDETSLHEAQPVIRGQKLIATKWLSTVDAEAGAA